MADCNMPKVEIIPAGAVERLKALLVALHDDDHDPLYTAYGFYNGSPLRPRDAKRAAMADLQLLLHAAQRGQHVLNLYLEQEALKPFNGLNVISSAPAP